MAANAAELLIDTISDWGVEVIFGLPGDGINGIMEALRQRAEKIRFVQVRHEESAAFMACARAWTSGGCCRPATTRLFPRCCQRSSATALLQWLCAGAASGPRRKSGTAGCSAVALVTAMAPSARATARATSVTYEAVSVDLGSG